MKRKKNLPPMPIAYHPLSIVCCCCHKNGTKDKYTKVVQRNKKIKNLLKHLVHVGGNKEKKPARLVLLTCYGGDA
jgi:hypothetical protein